ncbi:MAG: hypothetical protein R2789_07900 [Microthrixaceae bacterium]
MSAPGKKMNDAERVEVMLSVLPWLAAQWSSCPEVAEHFGVDRERLRDDLLRVFYDVEPEVGADNMVDVHIDDSDDEWVTVALPGSFEQPPRLDHSEALALLAAGTAFVDERGSEPRWNRRCASWARCWAPARQQHWTWTSAVETRICGDSCAPRWSNSARWCSSTSRGDPTRSGVPHGVPWSRSQRDGQLVPGGWCRPRGQPTLQARPGALGRGHRGSDPHPGPDRPAPPHREWVGPEHTVEVTLPVQHVWLVDSFPVESFEDLGDRVRVTVAVYSESWLDRLLVRLPEDATVHGRTQGTDLWRRRGGVARRIMIAAGIDPSADSVSA